MNNVKILLISQRMEVTIIFSVYSAYKARDMYSYFKFHLRPKSATIWAWSFYNHHESLQFYSVIGKSNYRLTAHFLTRFLAKLSPSHVRTSTFFNSSNRPVSEYDMIATSNHTKAANKTRQPDQKIMTYRMSFTNDSITISQPHFMFS